MSRSTDKGALTIDDFRQVSPTDKRREPRHQHRRMIQLLPCFTDDEWHFLWAELFDCSMHGLGFVMPQPMKMGQDFLIKLRVEKVLLLLYTVRYCVAENGKYRIGAEFSGLATDPERRDPKAVLEALLTTAEGEKET